MLIKTLCSSYRYIDFTVGVDADVVVKLWQLLEIYEEFVGGSHPNHFWDVDKISDDESVNLIK